MGLITRRVGRAVMQRLAKPCSRMRATGSIPVPSAIRLHSASLCYAETFAEIVFVMYYAYTLKQTNKNKFYVGYTGNLRRRLIEHNSGENTSTRSRTWEIYCYFAFEFKELAKNFEKYLKSHSGRAFSKKHFGLESGEVGVAQRSLSLRQ